MANTVASMANIAASMANIVENRAANRAANPANIANANIAAHTDPWRFQLAE